jgi:hypothetical protein
MDPLRFDRLTRALVGSAPVAPSLAARSRRQVLRGVVAGVVSTVAVARTSRRVAAALCPHRIPRPGYRPSVNGCGPSGFGWTVPDSFGRANFTPACNQHDRCYGTCNSNRRVCDNQLRRQMKRECNQVFGREDGPENFRRLKCLDRADFFYSKVNRHGQSAYEAAQEEACICCDPTRKCGTQCCPPGYECCNNVCRLSSIGPWHGCPGTNFCCGEGATCCGGANGAAACCSQGQVCVLNCIGGSPGCCPEENPGCCNLT